MKTVYRVGEPFKMDPVTRKARNASERAAMCVGIHADQLMWQRVGAIDPADQRFLVAAVGDDDYKTIRWVKNQDDPDWLIKKGEAK